MNPQEVLGVPGLTFGGAGVWVLVAIVATWVIRVWPKLRELRIAENSGLRREFIDEMHALRTEVATLRSENEMLRKEVRGLHAVIDGLRRENQSAQISGQRVIADRLRELPQGPKVVS